MGRVKKNQNTQDSSHNEIRITYSQIIAIITIIGSLISGMAWVSQGYSDYKDLSRITYENEKSIIGLRLDLNDMSKLAEKTKVEDYITHSELRFMINGSKTSNNKTQ